MAKTPSPFIVALALAALSCTPKPMPAPLELSSAGARVTFSPDGAFTLGRDGRTLLRFEPSAFQIGTVRELDGTRSYDPYWLVVEDPVLTKVEPPGFKWRVLVGTPTVTRVSDEEVRIDATFDPDVSGSIVVKTAAHGFTVRFLPNVESRPVAMLRIRARGNDTEGFYGLGEWFDDANHRGKLRPMQIEPDLSVESATTENHVVTPFLTGTTGWGLFVETKRYGVFSIAKEAPDLIDSMWGTADESGTGLTLHLFTADHPLELLAPYFQVTGFPRLPSPWAWGPLFWRNETDGQAEVLDDIATLRRLDLATSGMWIDRPYATAVNTFDFDRAKYPDAGAMIQAAHAEGLRMALWHTPYLEDLAAPFHVEASREGYFPPLVGLRAKWGPPLDFTNPRADAFWRERIATYRAMGIEGFKLDFAEEVAAGISGARTPWTFADGSTEKTMHYEYTRLYHRAYRSSLDPLDGFILARAGRFGSQTDGLVIWPGDIDATLTKFQEVFTDRGGKRVTGVGGLPAAIRAGQSLSMSGFPFFGADTGGYRHSPPNKETFMRWVSQSALSTVMQTGDSSSQPPWLFTPQNGRDAEALEHYRQFARLHLRLFPYGWTFATQMKTTGRPIQRPFGAQFPELGVHPADQYLLGDALLVAPIEAAGVTSRTLIHPPGQWVSWFDGRTLAGAPGETVTVTATLGELPVFVRAGALVPMLRPTIDTLSPTTVPTVDSFANDAGDLWVRVVPSPESSSFTLYDGATVSQREAGGALTLSSTRGTTFSRGIVYELFRDRPSSISSDGQPVGFVGSLDGVTSGALWENAVLRVKAPLGAEVVIR
jgi:alpha-D-xyloside xylohydrolase